MVAEVPIKDSFAYKKVCGSVRKFIIDNWRGERHKEEILTMWLYLIDLMFFLIEILKDNFFG